MSSSTIPLFESSLAATAQALAGFEGALDNTFDGDWIIDTRVRPVGPPWDVYGELSQWAARRQGPEGFHPWVELVERALDQEVHLELRIHAFSPAHLQANEDTPERLWFQPIVGEYEQGRGMAYSYRTGLTFDGPFLDGLPHGTGEHIFADGKALVDVVYEHGQLILAGHEKPEPVISAAGDQRDDWIEGYGFLLRDSAWDEFYSQPDLEWFEQPGSFLEPSHEPTYTGTQNYGRTCENCWGSGTVWATIEVAIYEDTMALSGTAVWRAGYDTIREWSTGYVDELVTCSYCRRTGYRDW